MPLSSGMSSSLLDTVSANGRSVSSALLRFAKDCWCVSLCGEVPGLSEIPPALQCLLSPLEILPCSVWALEGGVGC